MSKRVVWEQLKRKGLAARIVSLVLCAALCVSMCPMAYADPAEDVQETEAQESLDSTDQEQTQDSAKQAEEKDKKKSKDSAKKAKEKKAAKKEKKKAEEKQKKVDKATKAIKKMNSLTNELEMAYEDLNEINEKVEKLQKRIKRNKSKKKDTKADLKVAKEKLNELVRESYMNGKIRYMSVLLNAKDFGDFVSRIMFLDILAENEADAVTRIKKLQKKLSKTSDDLSDDLAEQTRLEDLAEAKTESIENSLKAQATYFNGLPDDIREAVLEDDGTANAWLDGAGVEGSTSKKGSHPKAAAEAMKYLGIKYVWGGSTPEGGFDCSGLTMYVYAKQGIRLTHFARSQYFEGKRIARDGLMPGDLVFFGDSVATIHHVGIYIGNDQFIHAPHTGDVVKISTLSARADYIGACRPKKAKSSKAK